MRPDLKIIALAMLSVLPAGSLAAEPLLPRFAPGLFTASQPNPYFPLVPGTSQTLTGTSAGDLGKVPAMTIRTVLGQGPVLMGVATTSVLVEEFTAGRIVERTMDYYATDSNGTVWYFGEDVTEYAYTDTGALSEQKVGASWHAGETGALPGILFTASPAPDTPTFIGHAPDAGEMDIGQIVAASAPVTVPAGTYSDVIKLYSTSATDPELREYTVWARDVGLIRVEEDLSPSLDHPKIELSLLP